MEDFQTIDSRITKDQMKDLLLRPDFKDIMKKAIVMSVIETAERVIGTGPQSPGPTDPNDHKGGDIEFGFSPDYGGVPSLNQIHMPGNLVQGPSSPQIPAIVDHWNKRWADQAKAIADQSGQHQLTPLESLLDDIFFGVADDDKDGSMTVSPIFNYPDDHTDGTMKVTPVIDVSDGLQQA